MWLACFSIERTRSIAWRRNGNSLGRHLSWFKRRSRSNDRQTCARAHLSGQGPTRLQGESNSGPKIARPIAQATPTLLEAISRSLREFGHAVARWSTFPIAGVLHRAARCPAALAAEHDGPRPSQIVNPRAGTPKRRHQTRRHHRRSPQGSSEITHSATAVRRHDLAGAMPRRTPETVDLQRGTEHLLVPLLVNHTSIGELGLSQWRLPQRPLAFRP